MLTKDFHFDLPEDLIAQSPCPERGADRLLTLDRATGAFADRRFADIPLLIDSGTLMVFNNSKVRRARLYATVDASGNRAEFLLVALVPRLAASLGLAPGSVWKAMAKNAKRQKPGRTYTFDDGTRAEILADPEGKLDATEFRYIRFDRPIDDAWLDANGHLPLPPYIRREDGQMDGDRYQTVYASTPGSVAAPTAGLHFTDDILSALDARGIERLEVTLHVGLGTFLPVRAERIEDHVMHEETYSVSPDVAERVTRAKREGRPVLAVGTTSIRTLESAWDDARGELRAGEGATGIFIYPGYRFKVVDRVFTNFHTPESTLLMLVSAFAGKENILAAYRHAIAERYRFFSYGDSMLIQ
jgi:S-adenosylmethionine:tRNA ribosyltransferase-isomerase